MPVNYASLQATANRLIGENGRAVAVRRTISAGPDWDPIQTTEDTATTAVQTKFDKTDTDAGWLIESNDVAYLLPPTSAPTTADKLVDGLEFRIVAVRQVRPGPLGMLWKVQARL